MRHITENFQTDITNNQKTMALISMGEKSTYLHDNKAAFEILSTEGREDFINYIHSQSLDNDPNLVFLSSQHYYYYDAEEMKEVKTVINLKEINQIKQIKSFLHSIFRVLPRKSNFIGCFVDNEKINGYELRNDQSFDQKKNSLNAIENGIVSRIPFLNMVFSIMDSRTNKYMSRRSVTLLLESHGFKVLNMSEINGLTYFHAQKVRTVDN
jgi:hypothetical protein